MSLRDAPYTAENRASKAAAMTGRGSPPGTLAKLISWFTEHWRAEAPDRIHSRGVWVGRQKQDPNAEQWPKELLGGSLLGSPPLSAGFENAVMGSERRTEHPSSDFTPELTTTYATPLRATISWIEREGRKPLLARWLRSLGRADGDWHTVTAAANLPDEYGEVLTHAAIRLCWHHYQEEST